MIKSIRKIISSIQTVEQYLEERKKHEVEHDRRIDAILMATLNGEQEWFLTLMKKDPECAIKIFKKCDLGLGKE